MADPDEATSSLGSEQSREDLIERLNDLAAYFADASYEALTIRTAASVLSTAHAEGLARQRELETERDEAIAALDANWVQHQRIVAAETRQRELEEALREIVAFCDDLEGSEHWESLAMGLSRLLPRARALLPPPTQDNPHG